MNKITIEQLFDLYIDTAKQYTSGITSLSDAEIAYRLFEEFDAGVRSFFHDDNLSKLCEAGKISRKAMSVSQEVRRTWIELESTPRTMGEIKSGSEWRRLFLLCDDLLMLLDE